ncbi:hypothetical protein H4R99_005356 [Coemansia sp. RSA 1722]|nr:hypothetical protein LPJ57_002193 [Coemansia sp. RSA 486]KAJ2595436.1 hypothetical protein H4R99_005356 [Coemansia sp. RSA 1722]
MVPACLGIGEMTPVTVVSSGELSSLVVHPRDPAKRVFRYIMSTATSPCMLGFAIGPFTSAYTLDGSLLAEGEKGEGEKGEEKDSDGDSGSGSKDNDKDEDEEKGSGKDGDSSARLGDSGDNNNNDDDDDDDDDDAQKVPSTDDQSQSQPQQQQPTTEAKTSHNSKLRKSTIDAIGGVFAFALPGHQSELETTSSFIPESLAFYSQEFGAYPYATYKLVFIDNLQPPVMTCASLTLVSSDFLHPRTVIEQVYETRRILGLAIAQQWFGTYIVAETFSDQWLVSGLAGYVAGLFVRHNLGQNEYRYRLKRDMQRVCHADVNQRPISYEGQGPVIRSDVAEFVGLKSAVVLHMLDRRMMKGGMSLGLHRIIPKLLVAAMSGDLGASAAVGTAWFLKLCRKVSGVDLKTFADQWVFGTGCPVFHFSYAFNRKKLAVEITMHQESTNAKATAPWAKPQLFNGQMTARIREADGTPYEHVLDIHEGWKRFEVQFNTKYKRIRRSTKRFHKRQLEAAEAELSVNADVLGMDDEESYSNIALFGAEDEMEKREWRVVEWGEDDEESLASATFEWIRMDPDLDWASVVHFEQPDFMWAAQLQKDRDVAAQLEAVDALQHLPSAAASTTLMRTVMDARVFYRVRVDAALALARFATERLGRIGLHHLLKIYANRYCIENESGQLLPKPNNFANVGEYFTQKAVLAALSNVRDSAGEAPKQARALLLTALRYNDNSENVYTDAYFLSSLVRAVASATGDSSRFARRFSVCSEPVAENALLAEIERLRKLDMLIPSFHNVITSACLDALLRLSLAHPYEHMFNTVLFFSMAEAAAYVGVREAAVGGLLMHWGIGDNNALFNRFFLALATDNTDPRLAATVSRYLSEAMMLRAMAFGRQHNSLLFQKESAGKQDATEHIDTDARLVGGMESFIDSIADGPEVQMLLAAALYDSRLPLCARQLLAAIHALVYQTVDCSLPPPPPAARKKLKIKLGSRMRKPMSNASSDSEDMPLALSVDKRPQQENYSIEYNSVSATKEPTGRKWQRTPSVSESTGLPLIAGTRPPLVVVPDTRMHSPAYAQASSGAEQQQPPPPPPPKVKLKLKFSKPAVSSDAPTSVNLHSTLPRVSSPLAAAPAMSPSRGGRNNSPKAWSPVYNPPDIREEPGYSEPIAEALPAKKLAKTPSKPSATTAVSVVSDSSVKAMQRILRKVSRHPSAFPFARPVDIELDGCPTYYEVIKQPMDLSSIRRRLDQRKYTRVVEFENDLRLMFNNCYTFNPAGTLVHEMGKELEQLFDQEWSAAGLVDDDAVVVVVHEDGDIAKAETMTAASVRKRKNGGAKTAGEPQRLVDADIRGETQDTAGTRDSESKLLTKRLKKQQTSAAKTDLHVEKKPSAKSPKPTATRHPASVKNPATATNSVKLKLAKPPSRQRQQDMLDPDAIIQYLDDTQPPSSAVPAGGSWKHMCNRVLLHVQAQPSALEFMAPVDPIKQGVPTYFDIIKQPMDLGTVRKKLDRSQYSSPKQFLDDVNLVFANCFLFNPPDTYVHSQGKALQQVFNSVWEQQTGCKEQEIPARLPEDIPVADKNLERARMVLGRIKKDENSWPFLKPVDPVAFGVPTYFDIIKNPMDFSTVQKKLAKKAYAAVADFVADLRLVFDDCFLFNPPDTPVHDCGKKLQDVVAGLLQADGWARWFS